MPGRRFLDEATLRARGYDQPEHVRRRAILRETLDAFAAATPRDRFNQIAAANLARWRGERASSGESEPQIRVVAGDWGEVTSALTREHGICFAVLNMANAFVPGGAYVEGTIAQEENMFRRTDCHFQVGADEYDETTDRYLPAMTRLLTGSDGTVYLDTEHPRVCIRGAEDRARADLGYPWLADSDVFPFFELRAAAQDLRRGAPFDVADARKRIAAQLDTLRSRGVRHAVLSAFGCGAFMNPAPTVAELYRDELVRRRGDFTVIAFAIFAAGYGPDNYTPFADVFASTG